MTEETLFQETLSRSSERRPAFQCLDHCSSPATKG